PTNSTGPFTVRTRYAVLPGVCPGTQSAHTEPSPKMSTTPPKSPLASREKVHSESAGLPSSARSLLPCHDVHERGGRGLARAGEDRRPLGHVRHARDVVQVQVRDEDGRASCSAPRSPLTPLL